MRFERLTLTGFKSFADPVEVEILPGLTGIVGPNGCGKSNVVEGLRWVMGTASAKALRAGGMEDVVFAGTEGGGRRGRAARRWAEVTLSIENEGREGPEAFRDQPSLEVSRRIVRGADGTSSTYRVNGREVRARDVQLLFADTGSGANSPALVRQGQINEIISAKPEARRRLLEEAAGITGLHARRHEAELRLRAAAQNLERLDDALGGLEARRASLQRQARQAVRYRRITDELKRAEALLVWLRYRAAAEAAATARAALEDAEAGAARARRAADEAEAERATRTDALPRLHRAEAEASTQLGEARAAAQKLESDLRQAEAVAARLREARERVGSDIARETGLRDEASGARGRAAEEQARLRDHEAIDVAALDAAAEAMRTRSEARDAEARSARETLAALEREASAARARAEAASGEAARLVRERTEIEARLAAEPEEASETETLLRLRDEAAAALAQAEQEAAAAEATRGEREAARTRADAPCAEAERRLTHLEAEREALLAVLRSDAPAEGALIDRVRTKEGAEAALAAALGEALTAGDDPAADRHWLETEANAAPLPSGAAPLADQVEAPDVLGAALSAIGVVAEEDGPRLARDLAPGQSLVTEAGDLWRWDGYVRRAGARSASAARLAQRRRLEELTPEIAEAERTARTARAASEATAAAAREGVEAERRARSALRDARTTLTRTDERLRASEGREAARRARGEALRARLGPLREAIDAAEATERAAQGALDEDALAAARETAETCEAALRSARAEEATAREAAASARRTREAREARLAELDRTASEWTEREAAATARLASLETVARDLAAQLSEAEAVPPRLRAEHDGSGTALAEAEAALRAARAATQEAETEARAGDEARRTAQEAAAAAGEARARQQALTEAAHRDARAAEAAAREAAGGEPDRLLRLAGLDAAPSATETSIAEVAARAETLDRDRERLGAVNLVAERELNELASELDALQGERGDCEAAINKLRAAVASLSRDGRARLKEAFDRVNAEFGGLFERLFGGGDARLELIGDDPLEAGLEVFASPPGKKLASLSLMSGGEQALTATALIFAVFLSAPAPICVLDEVDAPLDDANVERFCDLLRAMTERTDTRFLVVTHHPLTMSRMDRLYGVTMAEAGVSRLVSVDLRAAEEMAA